MKMLHNIYILLFLSCCMVSTLQAEALTLTLPEALRLARQNNGNLQSTQIDVGSAKRDVDTSWNLFLPIVNATLSNSGTAVVFQDNAFIKAATNSNAGLTAGLSLQFQLNPAVKEQLTSYDIAYSAQQTTYQQSVITVERNVTKLFYYLMAEGQNLELQLQQIALAEKQYGKAVANYEAGYSSEIEVLSAQLAIEQKKLALQQARNTYQGQMLSLNTLLGLPLDTDIVLEGSFPDLEFSGSLEQLQQRIDSTVGMEILRLNQKSLENTIQLQRKSALMPTLMLSAQYGLQLWNQRTKDNFNEVFSDTAQYAVSVSIPLDGHIRGSRTKVSLAKLQDSIDKIALTQVQNRNQMEQQIITQVNAIQNIEQQLRVAQANRDLALQIYAMYLTQYDNGYTDYLTVENAQQDVFSADQQIVYLQYQHTVALVDLAFDLQIDIDQL